MAFVAIGYLAICGFTEHGGVDWSSVGRSSVPGLLGMMDGVGRSMGF